MIGNGGGNSVTIIPITPLTFQGGVVIVIDSATGDIARTTSGWIEDIKYFAYASGGGSYSTEFDSAVTRTGRLTLKSSTTATASYSETFFSGGQGYNSIKGIIVKPSTSYRLVCYMKTNYISGDATNGAAISYTFSKSDGTSSAGGATSAYIKTTTDWTKYTLDITTGADTAYIQPFFKIYGHQGTATLIMDAWFDVNSMTLETVSSITNSGSSNALYYPSMTAVTSTNNIDQSQTTISGVYQLGNNSDKQRLANIFTPTKKNFTGIIFQKNADNGTFTGTVTVSIQATTAGLPNGTVIATSTYTNAQWEALANTTDITLALPCTLTAGTVYAVVFTPSTQDASNYAQLEGLAGAPNIKSSYNGSVWSAVSGSLYFKTLYSKNSDNFVVSTDTQTVSVTASTTDGYPNNTIVTFPSPLTLAPGANNIYVSSNGPSTADGTVDASLQGIMGGQYIY